MQINKYLFTIIHVIPDNEQMTVALFRNVYLQLYPDVNPHCSRKIGTMLIAYLSVVQGSDSGALNKALFQYIPCVFLLSIFLHVLLCR